MSQVLWRERERERERERPSQQSTAPQAISVSVQTDKETKKMKKILGASFFPLSLSLSLTHVHTLSFSGSFLWTLFVLFSFPKKTQQDAASFFSSKICPKNIHYWKDVLAQVSWYLNNSWHHNRFVGCLTQLWHLQKGSWCLFLRLALIKAGCFYQIRCHETFDGSSYPRQKIGRFSQLTIYVLLIKMLQTILGTSAAIFFLMEHYCSRLHNVLFNAVTK